MIKSADRTMSNQFSVFIRNKKTLLPPEKAIKENLPFQLC